jgi:hypothetical protein
MSAKVKGRLRVKNSAKRKDALIKDKGKSREFDLKVKFSAQDQFFIKVIVEESQTFFLRPI